LICLATKNKSEEENFFVGIESPLELRRQLLEASKKMVDVLKRYEMFREKREMKRLMIEKLKKNMADIAKMNAKLKSLLPKTSIRLGKPMQGQERPSPRVSVEEEKSPATEMERLELELTDIEGKLHKLGR